MKSKQSCQIVLNVFDLGSGKLKQNPLKCSVNTRSTLLAVKFFRGEDIPTDIDEIYVCLITEDELSVRKLFEDGKLALDRDLGCSKSFISSNPILCVQKEQYLILVN